MTKGCEWLKENKDQPYLIVICVEDVEVLFLHLKFFALKLLVNLSY